MIDVDRMESQLQSPPTKRGRAPKPPRAMATRPAPALFPSRRPTPAIPPAIAAASARVLARLRVPAAGAPPVEAAGDAGPERPFERDAGPERPFERDAHSRRPRSRLLELLDEGELAEADRLMADLSSRRERLSWATTRAILDGHQDTARAKNRAMHALAQEDRDRDAMDRYWLQRLWVVLTWGSDDERAELVEQCRDRAYRADDLQWTAALAVVLAQTGKAGEAGEAFEDAFRRLARAEESIQLDVATNLVEAAALLRDAFLAARLHYTLMWTPNRLVTVGEGWICKGAVERFRALGEAAAGMFPEADADFARAVARHRALGARPLLARTLHQWGTTLVGRDDDRAEECLGEASTLAHRLQLTGLGRP
jgi:tetratricopeptide (TPR) repeat protein